MKVVYSQPSCQPCIALKEQLKKDGIEFVEKVLHVDIPIDVFLAKYPQVRSVPFVVEE